MSSGLEARLQYLESREDSLTREMVRLKSENALANSKISELNATISQLKQEADIKSEKMDEDFNSILEYRQSIEDRLSRLESQVLMTRELDDRLSSLETIINNLREDVARCQRFASDQVETVVVKRLEEVDAVVKTQSRKVSKLVEEFETRGPEESLSAQACAPPPTPNTPTQSTPTPSTPRQSTPPAPPAKNLTVQEWDRLKERSQFDVQMSHSRTIQGRTRHRVEGYDGVDKHSDCLDTKTGVYKTPLFGPYRFRVDRLILMKDGGVKYYLCGGDGRRKEVFVSRESGGRWQRDYVDWDCPVGLEVWVEVEAGRGGVGLTYKVFFDGWLTI